MTTQEREKQVAIAFSAWSQASYYLLNSVESNWIRFTESDRYKSIPPATDELRGQIEERLKYLKSHIGFAYATQDRIDELEDLLKSKSHDTKRINYKV